MPKLPKIAKANATKPPKGAKSYSHPESDSPMRPEIGTQAQSGTWCYHRVGRSVKRLVQNTAETRERA